LTCIFVDDATWSTTNWTIIDDASTFVNNEIECNELSIQDYTNVSELSIYPNPSNGLSNINLGKTYNHVKLKIIDVLGKTIIEHIFFNIKNIELNTTNYANGLYFIQVKALNKIETLKLLVVK